ncbi:MAG: hypothetical protein Q4A72_04600 [Bacillota bacterium]|nr:hypothetical protein [Bacillota bacterium]
MRRKWFLLLIGILILLTPILFLINACFGNPISMRIADRAADKYIAQTYQKLDLERGEVFYDFKDGYYKVHLQDKNSEDTKFTVSFDGLGRLRDDNYEHRSFNTLRRFQKALFDYGKSIEKKEKVNYEINLHILDEENRADSLRLDEKVDFKKFPFSVEATVFTFREEPSYEEALAILKELRAIMDKEPFDVKVYSIIIVPEKDRASENEAQTWVNALTIHEIPEELIQNGSVEDLKKHESKMENRPSSAESPTEAVFPPFVQVDGKLYQDTGYVNRAIKCGTPDGIISSSVPASEMPQKDNQSNFGTNYEYQR